MLHPYATKRNSWNVSGDIIYAVDRGVGENAAVVADFPDRKAYSVQIAGLYRQNPPDPNLKTTLEQMAMVRAKTIDLDIAFKNPMDRPAVSVTVTANGVATSYVVDEHSKGGAQERLGVRVTADGTTAKGRILKTTSLPAPASTANEISVQVVGASSDGADTTQLFLRKWGVVRRDTTMIVLLPGDTTDFFALEPVTLTAS